MDRFALPLALVLLGCACSNDFVPEPLDEGCEVPGNPYIDNLVINSKFEPELESWCLCLKMDWMDPAQGATPPNMWAGYVSWEVSGYAADSFWLEESFGVEQGSPSGFITWVTAPEGGQEDEVIEFEIRARDQCGQVSNEKHGQYVLGSGKVVELYDGLGLPEGDGTGCDPASYTCAGIFAR